MEQPTPLNPTTPTSERGHAGASSRPATVMFADTAKVLAGVARSHGLTAPSYRTPPRTVGIDRTVRRTAHGGAVAVRVKGRPWPAVVADMIDGVIAINELSSTRASRVRADLWDAVLERVVGEPKPETRGRVA